MCGWTGSQSDLEHSDDQTVCPVCQDPAAG